MKNANDHFGYFHVYNRGVDKRNIFNNDKDRTRLLNCIRNLSIKDEQRYIKILAYCFMNNHFHLLVEQLCKNGLSKYMHRVGTAYTMYFNKKYKRSGSLFEARYKYTAINRYGHLLHLFRYIHLNPLKFFNTEWKSGIPDTKSAIKFLYKYEWSNLHELFRRKTDNSDRNIIEIEFSNKRSYSSFLGDWIKCGILNPSSL